MNLAERSPDTLLLRERRCCGELHRTMDSRLDGGPWWPWEVGTAVQYQKVRTLHKPTDGWTDIETEQYYRGVLKKERRKYKQPKKFTSTFFSKCLWTPPCAHHVGLVKEEGLHLRIKVPFAQQR